MFLLQAYKTLLFRSQFYVSQYIPSQLNHQVDQFIQIWYKVLDQVLLDVFSQNLLRIIFWQFMQDLYLQQQVDHIQCCIIWLFTSISFFWFLFTVDVLYQALFILQLLSKQLIQLYQIPLNIKNMRKVSSNNKKKNRSFQKSKRRQNQNSDSDISQTEQITIQNNRIRHQLLELSKQLDSTLEKAANHKMKISISPVIASTKQSKEMELQNALKIIDRLKKTVKDFENKEAYDVSYKRVSDLQSIIKKKQDEIEELRMKIKKNNKSLKDQQRNVSQLLHKQQLVINVNENKEKIDQLKEKIKKLSKQNSQLMKKDQMKEQKLYTAQRKIQQLEWIDQKQIGRSQQLLENLQNLKLKYKNTMNIVEKQNQEIIKLNLQISKSELNKKKKRPPKSYSYNQSPRKISKSVEQLPNITKNISQGLPHLPKRY